MNLGDRSVLAHDWTDDDGQPLGSWVEVNREEWRKILADAGGLDAMTVFASLTDPDGTYGTPQIYTAWGHRDDRTPLLDVRDYKDDSGLSVLRKFVPERPVILKAGGSALRTNGVRPTEPPPKPKDCQ